MTTSDLVERIADDFFTVAPTYRTRERLKELVAIELDRRVNEIREAFLSLVADAHQWEEDGDEEGIVYLATLRHENVKDLANLLGIESKYVTTDPEIGPRIQTIGEAIDAAIDRTALEHQPDMRTEK